MQPVAAEMNLSETAFLVPRGDGGRDLRWFTPEVEVDLCGHATLASAHHCSAAAARFLTAAAACSPAQDARRLDRDRLPGAPARADRRRRRPARGLGTPRSRRCPQPLRLPRRARARRATCGPSSPTSGHRRARHPGRDRHRRRRRARHRFVSRFFAPAVGVDEDPVTGSAHCALGALLGRAARPDRSSPVPGVAPRRRRTRAPRWRPRRARRPGHHGVGGRLLATP